MHEELIRRNALTEGIIYMQVTRGAADRAFNFPKEKVKPTLIAFTQPMSLVANPNAVTGVKISPRPISAGPGATSRR
jgi:D-alanine transaminase